jgi:hypothetical protein
MARAGQRHGGEARDKRTAYGGTHGGTGRRDGQQDNAHTAHPHPTRLPPNLLLGAAVNGEKYPVFKIMCKMFLEKLKGLFFS